ncbi:DUF4442 domain-containing protein [Reichenbachiella sp. 5M10]|uniref:DUF4442 domain-containing protein n=1 Tax=Reichenbachiella sp. 5M10 TaxID=1889772 RepID=UPI000C149B9D|nr:DUF4442 domain-containing protein [Reichenbachiella sp. 5M10]PIB35920.1 DUF4442 domain-containing protein [Reichenbachiella sp. 5M10]
MYDKIYQFLNRFFKTATLFKALFNLAPMYRRSVGRVKYVSDDLMLTTVEIPLNYKNRNYVGTMFGGSLFSATDPIYMIQLVYILGKDYVVWDKAALIRFKRPATERAYARFEYTPEEVEQIKRDVAEKGEIDITKMIYITNKQEMVFSEVEKTIYVASKSFYNEKKRKRALRSS